MQALIRFGLAERWRVADGRSPFTDFLRTSRAELLKACAGGIPHFSQGSGRVWRGGRPLGPRLPVESRGLVFAGKPDLRPCCTRHSAAPET
jgi:hypothetical protein